MAPSETLSQEFTRLVDAYLGGERQYRQEAWNLIADFAVENSATIRNALDPKGMEMDDPREYTGPNAMLAEIERLTAERDEWKAAADIEARLRRRFNDEAECLTAENERLRAALSSCQSWIDRWTAHVGTCKGGDKCTCGRSAVLFDASDALNQQSTREKQNEPS